MPFSSSFGLMRWTKRSFRKWVLFENAWESTNYKSFANIHETLSATQLLNPVLWTKWAASFVFHWFLSRPYSNILVAIPAVVLGTGLFSIILFSTSDYSQVRASRYRTLFDASVDNRDYDVASVVLRSLIDNSPQNLELKYQQALVEERRGNTELATKQMDELAMSHDHGLAAMWMISKESELHELKTWPEQKHSRFRKLIDIGLNHLEGENLLSAKVLMFSYLAEIGDYSDAGRYLSEVVPARPELALAAATLSRSQHDSAGAERFAMIAERHFESKLLRQPADINARINLARALMIRTRFEEAAKLLNDGYRLTKDSRLTGVIGEALLVWSNHLGSGTESSKNLVKRFQILHAAVGVAPSDPAVGSAIAQLIIECRDNRSPEVIQLKEAILAGTAPVSTHFIRGTLALHDNHFEEAKRQLELALQHEPNAPTVLNNLAVAVAGMQDGDLQKALSLVDTALTKLPKNAYFLETRGQILVKLKRWQESIPDLELALEAKELRPAIYPSLALAYEKIGAADLSQFYQNLTKGAARAD